MGLISTGKAEGLLYSLSRWTDVPISKWDWFRQQLALKCMLGVDPRTAMPGFWSLKPEDVLGLVFWTKDPTNLIRDVNLLDAFPLVIHVTLTGWTEVEQGAPGIEEGLRQLARAVDTFGVGRVVWRFSPVPLVPDIVDRFSRIARVVQGFGINQVYVSFLQENDRLPEQRNLQVRQKLLHDMTGVGMEILVCNEDRVLNGWSPLPANLAHGVCENGNRFTTSFLVAEKCGCALSVDPFTINESCVLDCKYCYAADRSLAEKRRDTA